MLEKDKAEEAALKARLANSMPRSALVRSVDMNKMSAAQKLRHLAQDNDAVTAAVLLEVAGYVDELEKSILESATITPLFLT